METNDRRTEGQRATHTMAVVGTDRFMSGWGLAKGGASYAGWACRPEDVERVREWVKSRGDMKRVRVVNLDGYRPRGPGHFSLYVWSKDYQ